MNISLMQLTRMYVRERRSSGEFSSDETARTIRYTLISFSEHVAHIHPIRLRRQHVEEWLASGRYKPASVRARLSRVRQFCLWLVERSFLPADPTAGIKGPRKQRTVPRGLPPSDVHLTLEAVPDRRGQVVVLLMVQEGLRCAEVAHLQIGDVDFHDRLMVVRGKGGHQRVLPISDETWEALSAYIAENGSRTGPVVRSKTRPERGITSNYISFLVRDWMGSANVPASAHALRHTCAGDLIRSGVNLRDIQQILGHMSLSTTEIYLPWIVGDLRTAMAGRRYASP